LAATLYVVTGASYTRLLKYPGASPPPPYPDTWEVGDLIANNSQSLFNTLAPGTATGGDVNVTGSPGTFVGGVASIPATQMGAAAQSISSGHANGNAPGQGGLSVDGVVGNGAGGQAWFTWGR